MIKFDMFIGCEIIEKGNAFLMNALFTVHAILIWFSKSNDDETFIKAEFGLDSESCFYNEKCSTDVLNYYLKTLELN